MYVHVYYARMRMCVCAFCVLTLKSACVCGPDILFLFG